MLHIDITCAWKAGNLKHAGVFFSLPKVGQQSVKRSSGTRLEPLGRWRVSSRFFGKEEACDLGSG